MLGISGEQVLYAKASTDILSSKVYNCIVKEELLCHFTNEEQGLLKDSPANKQLSHGYTTLYLTLNLCKHFEPEEALKNHFLFKTQFFFYISFALFNLIFFSNCLMLTLLQVFPPTLCPPPATHASPSLGLYHTIVRVHGVCIYVL